uniref:Uncharacterized protein n=1 Tax=Oreochromis aureus TaxID=47969 RepID=A0AAZ1XEZ5_OREAU
MVWMIRALRASCPASGPPGRSWWRTWVSAGHRPPLPGPRLLRQQSPAFLRVERRQENKLSSLSRTKTLSVCVSAMEGHSLLNPTLQSTEGVLSSFRTTWQEFVEDLGFWRVLLLLVVIALLSLGIAYHVSRVLPFSGWRGGRKIDEDLYLEQKLWYLFVVQI